MELEQLRTTNNKTQQWMAAAVERQKMLTPKFERVTSELEDKHWRETTVADATVMDKAAQAELEQLHTVKKEEH